MISEQSPILEEYLATGFAHVDALQHVEPFVACLTLLDTLPYFRAYKERSYELLGPVNTYGAHLRSGRNG
jgi:hypothetical protein